MADEEKEGQASNAVPYDRFVTVNDQRKEYQAKVADLTAQLAAVEKQAGAADALFTQLESVNATLESERQAWTQERSLMGAGLIDQEARDLAVWSYNRQPEEGRPALGEWLDGMRAEGADVPQYLAPYFKGAAQDQAPPAPTMPDTNRGAIPQDIESGGHKRGSISGMTADEYREHRDRLRQRWLKS
jgi:hypothetical protein